ncbi:MAG: histidine phosphatase family protein [Actinobacteria bacterium]|nr:histidine phosphatase family protein [Actinomycetota bacterium]
MRRKVSSCLTQVCRLILIRHADTDATCIHDDPGLSPMGELQAERLRDRFMATGELGDVTGFYSSTLNRSRATAQLLASAIGSADLQLDSNLREMFWGEAEGHSWVSMVKDYGVPSGKDSAFADGETWNEFERRARSALHRYAALPGTTIVVCHTGIIEASFIQFAGLSRRALRFAMAPRNASITIWTELDGGTGVRRLDVYNDATHLWSKGEWLHRPESLQSEEPFWNALEPGTLTEPAYTERPRSS